MIPLKAKPYLLVVFSIVCFTPALILMYTQNVNVLVIATFVAIILILALDPLVRRNKELSDTLDKISYNLILEQYHTEKLQASHTKVVHTMGKMQKNMETLHNRCLKLEAQAGSLSTKPKPKL